MKNRISLALKDPNLQQGFEIICKNLAEELVEERIAELEQEKCELLGIIQGKDKVIKDLKEDNKVMSDNYSKMEQKFYDNFSEAKVIIKLLLWDLRNRSYQSVEDIEQAEQFLKEE